MKLAMLWTAGLCAWLVSITAPPAGALPGC
jgi:hypothetical protein